MPKRSISQPYYSENGITIYHGDCREVLPMLDVCADMVIGDPPYGETSLEWDSWPDGWIRALSSVIGKSSSFWCFGSFRMFWDRSADFAAWRFVQDVVWEKHNGSGFFNDRFRRVHETVAHFVPKTCAWADVYKSPQFTLDAVARTVRKKSKPAQWQGATGATTYVSEDGGPRLMRSVQFVRSSHGMAEHPTQKPLGIIAPLINYSCPPNGLIVVPFAGSGSDLVAAKKAGVQAIGVEAKEEFCEVAVSRLRQQVLRFA